MKSCIIIGGGCGGLFSGAVLARLGWRVTVLEKNRNIGGGLSTFRREGVDFQPGMHIVAGFGDAVGNVFRLLGIDAGVENCPRRIFVFSDGSIRELPPGEAETVEYLCREFPSEERGIRAYYRRIREIYDSVPLLGWAASLGSLQDLFSGDISDLAANVSSEDGLVSADSFIDHYICDPRLKAILGSLNLLSGTEKAVTPAYIHGIVNELYTRQFAIFPQGTESIVRQLCGIISSAGGQVIGGAEVKTIRCGENADGERIVSAVTTADGRKWTADAYIGAVSPALLASICVGKGPFTKFQKERIDRLRDGFSMFSVYAVLSPDSPVPEGACFCYRDYCSVWEHCSSSSAVAASSSEKSCSPAEVDPDSESGSWPDGVLFTRHGNRLTALSAMAYSEVEKWSDSRSGRRGKEYEEWKARKTDAVIEAIAKATSQHYGKSYSGDPLGCDAGSGAPCSDISSVKAALGIRVLCSASPLSIRDWFGTRSGAAYGFSIDCHDPLSSGFSPRTKAANFFLTGQSIYLHGLCGTMMSALLTAKAIIVSQSRG